MKQYWIDNEGDPWHITEQQTWDLKRNYGYVFVECTEAEFKRLLVREGE